MAIGQLARDRLVAAGDRGCRPAASPNVVDERSRTNACCTAVNQMRKGVRVEPTRTPVPHDHRGRRTAAQRFGLGDERNVENGERAARLSALRRSNTQHDGQQRAEGSHADRATHHPAAGRLTPPRRQSIATMSRISTSKAMMITVVEITILDWPPASA